MELDLRTLLLVDALVIGFLAVALTLSHGVQKTYDGYMHWVLGTFLVAFGFLSMVLRPALPQLPMVLIATLGFATACVLRLEGVVRFVRGRSIWRWIWPVIVIQAIGSVYFTVVHDSVAARNALLGLPVVGSTCAAGVLCWRSGSNRSGGLIYWLSGMAFFLYAALFTMRALLLLSFPESGLYTNEAFNVAYFLLVSLIEIAWSVAFLMMQGQRLDGERATAETALRETIESLEHARQEAQTLGRLLPMCASCSKVKDEDGRWDSLDAYVRAHTETDFSHGLCPGCAGRLYPDMDLSP